MKLLLYKDHTVAMDLASISAYLREVTLLSVSPGQATFEVPGPAIRYPETYRGLSQDVLSESQAADLSICATRRPYENNFFFHYSGGLAIVSFYAWEQLTSLPLDNGLVYFVTSLLRRRLPSGDAHEEATGCLNDFLWDKTGIDVGMRSGWMCQKCASDLDNHKLTQTQVDLRAGIDRLLHDLGSASRANRSVLDLWRQKTPPLPVSENDRFDVFLCHNSQDKADVKSVAARLKKVGVRVWLDEEQLRPGLLWQVALEQQIQSIKTAAVFVGGSGIGPWQDMEMRAFLSEFAHRQCPVIPVILRSAGTVPELPIFMRQLTWVDFRVDEEAAVNRLVWGITGRRIP